MEKLKQYLIKIAQVFEYKNDDQSFFSFLKTISKPSKQVCNKEVKIGEGGWKCYDCEIDTQSLICNYCFSKSKTIHKGHKVIFSPDSYGFCDCGDPNCISKKGFCPEHQGPFTNKKDLLKFIQSSINKKQLNEINILLDKIFLLFIEKINILYNKESNNKVIKRFEVELFNMVDKLVSFISNLNKNNLELFYFVTLKFTENVKFETNHKCFNYNEKENKIKIIKQNLSEKHICICPFFQILINILMKKKTKQDSNDFFSLFIQNYKNKLITGLSLLHSFPKIFDNNNLKNFRKMAYLVLTGQICELVYDEKNIDFLNNFFIEVYYKMKEFISSKLYDKAEELLYRIYEIVHYLPKLNTINKIKHNLQIHKIIIDIICLINNLNVFKNKINFQTFQRDGFLNPILNIEIYCIKMAILFCYLIEFDNSDSVKFIFKAIISKIIEYKNNKESSNEKTFTPHIVCIKYYSIFLNRFCFNYSIKNNCDLLDSFQYFQNIIPESKKIHLFMFKELINFFGFMISQKYGFFIYYGEEMEYFYDNYFGSSDFILPDITLMKYLLTLPEIEEEFNIDKILIYNIDSCNDFCINLKEEDLIEKSEYFDEKIKNENKNLKYINSIFEFLLIIIRDNDSMINLVFKDSNIFRMKYKDIIFENLMLKEKVNFNNIIKNRIIHYILGKRNIISREDCIQFYQSFGNNLDLKFVDNLLKEYCDKISLSNQLKNFSLKKSIFPICDIDYIINSSERKEAIQYLMEFQSENYHLLNTYILKPLSIQEKLNKKIFDNFFKKSNIDKLINFYSFIVSYNNQSLIDIFFFNCSKIICVYIKSYNYENLDEIFKKKLIEIINNKSLEENNSNLIQYIKKLILKEDIIDTNKKNEISNKPKSLKEKFKKKFSEKNQIILNKFSKTSEINFEKVNSKEICVYCRKPLDNDLNNYYGNICYLFSDFFIDILKNKKEKFRNKTRRFVTCNHKIHFNCYSEFIVEYIDYDKLKKEFPCPLCKKLSNIIICDFNNLDKNYNNFIKGLDFENNKNKINDFNIVKDNINNYKDFILYNKNFIEQYYSKVFKKKT